MFNNHKIFIMTEHDVNSLNTISPDRISVVKISTDNMNIPNSYNGSILIPPTDMLMKWADGEIKLDYFYTQYLNTTIANDMIVSIIALLKKKDVIIYMSVEDMNIYGSILLNYINFYYGIICETPFTRFNVDPNKIPFIISRFYMIGVMSAEDYLEAFPANALLPDFVIPKLMEDYGLENVDIISANNHFNKMNSEINKKPLVNMVKVI